MSDSDGNLSVDTTGILKNYIDTSISNLEGTDYNSGTTLASLQTNISDLQGTGYASTTTLASLQTAYDTLNKWVSDYCVTNNQGYYITGIWGNSAPCQLKPGGSGLGGSNVIYSKDAVGTANTRLKDGTVTSQALDTSLLDTLYKFQFTKS